MEEKFIVGLMSGTSVDGIDAALTRIIGSGNNTKVEVLNFITLDYSKEMRGKIFQAMDPERSSTPLICSLNFELGYCFADAVKKVCRDVQFELKRLNAVGSHGQTIYHIPQSESTYIPSTLQIGEPAVIAYQTKTSVISNFRVMDMAAGGQGAPLVPYIDYLLFKNQHKAVALQNIGGISNVTVLPENCSLEDVYAFDTGPGNMIIDELVRRFYGINYDPNGKYAKQGEISQPLLNEMMEDPYIKQFPPKTTGRESYGKAYVDRLLESWRRLSPNDLIATATYFTAKSIAQNYENFILSKHKIEEIIVSGGGSYNQALMTWLDILLPQLSIKTAGDYGVASDAKEAVAFAILANEFFSKHSANVPMATGAEKSIVLGNWTPYIDQK
ncbi:anhydro-N-acetylmuramic acid kinase [Pullulanibacillus pueri]|nr:anhydro-N-acetylmuramic acid kinase AnmK [Pullulanibacillus pueri]MBM7681852.1 anhydro-N-acetylmuramic acid kinase [Pullulanibacillus pueri]